MGVDAYETTTKQKLGSEFALSSSRSTWDAGTKEAAMAEALNDAMGKLIPQITAYWKEDKPKGNRYNVILENAPKGADEALYPMFKKNCAEFKFKEFKTKVEFNVQCKTDLMETHLMVKKAINKEFDNPEFEDLKNSNILIYTFK